MQPLVSIIMGSTSDLPVMDKAAKLLDELEIPFEINALSAHRTPAEVETFKWKLSLAKQKTAVCKSSLPLLVWQLLFLASLRPTPPCP